MIRLWGPETRRNCRRPIGISNAVIPALQSLGRNLRLYQPVGFYWSAPADAHAQRATGYRSTPYKSDFTIDAMCCGG